jgi:hypothetical protein
MVSKGEDREIRKHDEYETEYRKKQKDGRKAKDKEI